MGADATVPIVYQEGCTLKVIERCIQYNFVKYVQK